MLKYILSCVLGGVSLSCSPAPLSSTEDTSSGEMSPLEDPTLRDLSDLTSDMSLDLDRGDGQFTGDQALQIDVSVADMSDDLDQNTEDANHMDDGSVQSLDQGSPPPLLDQMISDQGASPADLADLGDAQDLSVPIEGTADWFTSFGGTDHEEIKAMTVDSQGNIYAVGVFYGDLMIGDETIDHTEPGSSTPDAFVVSFDPMGELRWVQTFGAVGADIPFQIATDHQDHLYVAGYHHSDLTVGDEVLLAKGDIDSDLFIISYDMNGQQLWAKNWGGSNSESLGKLAINAAGDLFLAGTFQGNIQADSLSAMTPIIFGALSEIFVLAIDGVTHEARWLTSFSGYGHDVPTALAVDDLGETTIAVSFQNDLMINSEIRFNAQDLNFNVGLVHLDSTGAVSWAREFRGSGSDEIKGLGLDDQGQIYITGLFSGVTSFGGPPLRAFSGNDVMLAGYSELGEHLWSVSYVGESFDQALDLKVDGDGVYITGRFKEDLNFGPLMLSSPENYDIFLGRFSTLDGAPIWVDSVGGDSNEQANAIEVVNGSIFVGGYHQGPVQFGEMNIPSTATSNDAFVFRYTQ